MTDIVFPRCEMGTEHVDLWDRDECDNSTIWSACYPRLVVMSESDSLAEERVAYIDGLIARVLGDRADG